MRWVKIAEIKAWIRNLRNRLDVQIGVGFVTVIIACHGTLAPSPKRL